MLKKILGLDGKSGGFYLALDEDKSNQFYLGLYQRVINLFTRTSELSSFMTPEIQSIPDEIIKNYMADKSLLPYRFYLEKILRNKPHTLNETIEEILAMSQEIAQTPGQVFG